MADIGALSKRIYEKHLKDFRANGLPSDEPKEASVERIRKFLKNRDQENIAKILKGTGHEDDESPGIYDYIFNRLKSEYVANGYNIYEGMIQYRTKEEINHDREEAQKEEQKELKAAQASAVPKSKSKGLIPQPTSQDAIWNDPKTVAAIKENARQKALLGKLDNNEAGLSDLAKEYKDKGYIVKADSSFSLVAGGKQLTSVTVYNKKGKANIPVATISNNTDGEVHVSNRVLKAEIDALAKRDPNFIYMPMPFKTVADAGPQFGQLLKDAKVKPSPVLQKKKPTLQAPVKKEKTI